ncbi:MAG: sulfur carrier protein ThiS [SAR202 cluster bacterium]|jgi:sulfur carrier protein|nr:thiamine biosynthesis protein ThiS [Chloroflexota bacterium]MDP6419714.1 sulfur carrier protein ThiS [SAR202 cluster bacterium]HAL49204.1 thiamine biosynthesis protein ThiS [Dehalococcoidia bacterium]MDP6663909.1 sulfur carrier protein ThiS [SAR202 cluster bacterium]MDP6801510.1 sulfur carrier protein ThiS [SAR202 cluster bacterium]|tara:strand:- start:1079 stop:1282 length:204 start_codon:yes stop_codon:yes gene_type:complete
MISLTINGKSVDLDDPMNLAEYLESLGVADRSIAVGYNGTIIRKDERQDVTLSEGDRLEIVRAVGGG